MRRDGSHTIMLTTLRAIPKMNLHCYFSNTAQSKQYGVSTRKTDKETDLSEYALLRFQPKKKKL